jgi:exopolysaccharide biosynthesis polyprenyl glycosylphosphotransferase
MSQSAKKTLLRIGDFSILWISLIAALILRRGELDSAAFWLHVPAFSIISLLWLTVFTIMDLYALEGLRNNLEFSIILAKALFANALISTGFFYFMPGLAVKPKTVLFLMLAIALVLMLLWRRLFNALIKAPFLQKRSVIIGWDAATLELASALEAAPQLGYTVVRFLRLPLHHNPPLPESLRDREAPFNRALLEEYLAHEEIESIIISPEVYREPEIAASIHHMVRSGIEYLNTSTLFERTLQRVPLTLVDQVWFMERITEGRRRAYELFTRALDLVIACLVGVIFLPLTLGVAFAIKWDSRGPVFYRQWRLGGVGKPFRLLKFRSMVALNKSGGAELAGGARFTGKNDPRITRVGKFIRKTHLDELPQFWNILEGEMAVVGPRPERPEFYHQWRPTIPFFEQRLIVKPGITGWAQLHYTYGDTPEAARRNLQHDLYYIKNRSLLFDIAVMLKTIRVFFRGGGR